MTRHFLGDEAQAAYSLARLDAVRELGRLAQDTACEFVVVAGDVFESNQVDRRTVARAFEALAQVSVPVYLLPGNHDSLDAASVYRSPCFAEHQPRHVRVLTDTEVLEVRPGLELVGAPWTSRRPLEDLVARTCASLEPARGKVRVCVGHGAIDTFAPDPNDPALIRLAAAEDALRSRRIHYLALGDRHSLTPVGATGRIHYCGSPEPTDYDEDAPGHVLVVNVDEGHVAVEPRRVGVWRFARQSFAVNREDDLEALASWLEEQPSKDRTVLKLGFSGTLTLTLAARLEDTLEHARDLYAAVESPERHRDLVVLPDDEDFRGLDLAGFAAAAVDRLRASLTAGSRDAEAAGDALKLLVRLARRAS